MGTIRIGTGQFLFFPDLVHLSWSTLLDHDLLSFSGPTMLGSIISCIHGSCSSGGVRLAFSSLSLFTIINCTAAIFSASSICCHAIAFNDVLLVTCQFATLPLPLPFRHATAVTAVQAPLAYCSSPLSHAP